jgi:hypothetical protein
MPWSDWYDWEGGSPPGPPGTLVDAYVMKRVRQLVAAGPMMTRLEFTVVDGSSFELDPKVPMNTWLVYRYRYWMDVAEKKEDVFAECEV